MKVKSSDRDPEAHSDIEYVIQQLGWNWMQKRKEPNKKKGERRANKALRTPKGAQDPKQSLLIKRFELQTRVKGVNSYDSHQKENVRRENHTTGRKIRPRWNHACQRHRRSWSDRVSEQTPSTRSHRQKRPPTQRGRRERRETNSKPYTPYSMEIWKRITEGSGSAVKARPSQLRWFKRESSGGYGGGWDKHWSNKRRRGRGHIYRYTPASSSLRVLASCMGGFHVAGCY